VFQKILVHADRIIFAVAANISIASLNLSLMVNTVGFYQIAKLLIVPFTAVVQSAWLKESLTFQQALCTAVVLLGVAVVYAPFQEHGQSNFLTMIKAPSIH
jgi:drug/metabolite transporter (DMT)-like permease